MNEVWNKLIETSIENINTLDNETKIREKLKSLKTYWPKEDSICCIIKPDIRWECKHPFNKTDCDEFDCQYYMLDDNAINRIVEDLKKNWNINDIDADSIKLIK